MFSSFSGYRSQYDGLTLVVVAEFNEWKVLAYGPGVTIHGSRQFTEAGAKDHALMIARTFVAEKQGSGAAPADVDWQPTSGNDWLVWR